MPNQESSHSEQDLDLKGHAGSFHPAIRAGGEADQGAFWYLIFKEIAE